MNQTEAAAFIDQYDSLRTKCYDLARLDDGARMGDDFWMLYALVESDIQLEARRDGIGCTSSSASEEAYDFTISYADIDNYADLMHQSQTPAE